ncbi:MAG: hypothetical protein GX614_09160 [Sandaracinaceae bacterium]|nr:hypothetical protein [Sandaracinaceae bacterium]
MPSLFLALLLTSPLPTSYALEIDPSIVASAAVHTAGAHLSAEGAVAMAKGAELSSEDVARLLDKRRKIGKAHQWLGISTWIAMTAASVFGTIQYRNLYGFFSPLEATPCVEGRAIFGQDACIGRPVSHTTTVALGGALYFTTFGLSFAMPDPIGLDEGDSKSARRLRQHKRLRWAHLGGMAAQILLGILSANGDAFGLSRSENYRALQGIATAHLLVGYATYATLTWSGAIMLK